MKKTVFDLSNYAARRTEFLAGLGDVTAIFAAAPVRTRSNDVEYRYRPLNDMLYLCGFDEPDSVLVLRPGAEQAVVLFVRPRDPKKEQWNGDRAGVEGAVERFGVDLAFPIGEFSARLPDLLTNRDDLYYSLGVNPALDQTLIGVLEGLRGTRVKANRAPKRIVDPRTRLHRLRLLKSEAEIAVMRRAADIAAEAHVEAMRTVQVGQMEYEVAALLDYGFQRRGAEGPGYPTIVGGGANATVLHYTANRDPLRDGDLVLIDAGAEFDYYNSDITRTFPVGSAFTPPQRSVYEAVLALQEEAISRVKPGVSMLDLSVWSKREMTRVLVELELLKGDLDELYENQEYEKFYMHNLGHYLGMDVHDVGEYLVAEDSPLPLEPGAVLTVEPGIYIPAKCQGIPGDMKGIGVRIEDDILVTETGCENLTSKVPKSIEEIEALRLEASK